MKAMIAVVMMMVLAAGSAMADTIRDEQGRIVSLDTPAGTYQFHYPDGASHVFDAVMFPDDAQWTPLPGDSAEGMQKALMRESEKQRSARGIIRTPFQRIDSSEVHRSEQGGNVPGDLGMCPAYCPETYTSTTWSDTVSQINAFSAIHDFQDRQACMSRCADNFAGSAFMCQIIGLAVGEAGAIVCTGGAYAASLSCQNSC